ncbi:MAG: hypothetical protein GF350_15465 [Chitinivibrionales bacterium]|nr:hypothetical protein [Chitinivibrionales bacterium]
MHLFDTGKIAGIVAALIIPLYAAINLPVVIDNNMVLQQGKNVPIWGTASPGASITVQFAGQTKTATAGGSGDWKVFLSPLNANAASQQMTISGDGSNITLDNILVGEVWIGSGQSNMEYSLQEGKTTQAIYDEIIANAPYDNIRILCDGRDLHQQATSCTWEIASASNLPEFSSLLFQFGRELGEQLDVPVGLIEAAMGAVTASYWATGDMVDGYNSWMEEEWEKDSSAAAQAGDAVPPKPFSAKSTSNQLGTGYRDMVEGRIEGFGVRGIYWDQGESGPGYSTKQMFPIMGAIIYGWQIRFEQDDLWFIYNQKPNGGGPSFHVPTGAEWPLSFGKVVNQDLPTSIDSSMDSVMSGYWFYAGIQTHDYTMIEKFPRTLMASSADLSEGSHPRNKKGNALRAARGALGYVYGKTDLFTDYTGPRYDGYSLEGSSIRIYFKHAQSGLAPAQISTLQGFVICGQDSVWHWADARIENDTQVVVWNDSVTAPVEARYAYSRNISYCNLFNNDSIPAAAFRTGQERMYYVPGQESLPVRTQSEQYRVFSEHIRIGSRWIAVPGSQRGTTLRILTLSGKTLFEKALPAEEFRIDTQSAGMPSGCYLLQFRSRGYRFHRVMIHPN